MLPFMKKKRSAVENLKATIERVKKTNPEKGKVLLAAALSDLIQSGEWIWMQIKQTTTDEGYQLQPDWIEDRGRFYLAWYTASSEIKKQLPGYRILQTEIKKVLDPMFHIKEIDGMVINPDSDLLFLEKETVLEILLHSPYPMRNLAGDPPKKWGKGIPIYYYDDVVAEEQLHYFAMYVVAEQETQRGYQMVSSSNHRNVRVNLILKKDRQIFLVTVTGRSQGSEKTLSPEQKKDLCELAGQYGAVPCHAVVDFCSEDPERSAAQLILRGDGLMVDYFGLQPL